MIETQDTLPPPIEEQRETQEAILQPWGIFDVDTGRLVELYRGPQGLTPPERDGCVGVEGAYEPDRHYLGDDGVVYDAGLRPSADYYLDGRRGFVAYPDRLAHAVREERNRLLADSDYIELQILRTELAEMQGKPMLFGGIDSGEAEAWRKYRQELRDITKQAGFPMEVVWPEPPTRR